MNNQQHNIKLKSECLSCMNLPEGVVIEGHNHKGTQQDNWRERFKSQYCRKDGGVIVWNEYKDITPSMIIGFINQTEQRIREEKDREFEEMIKDFAFDHPYHEVRRFVNRVISAIKSNKDE